MPIPTFTRPHPRRGATIQTPFHIWQTGRGLPGSKTRTATVKLHAAGRFLEPVEAVRVGLLTPEGEPSDEPAEGFVFKDPAERFRQRLGLPTRDEWLGVEVEVAEGELTDAEQEAIEAQDGDDEAASSSESDEKAEDGAEEAKPASKPRSRSRRRSTKKS